MTDQDPRPDLPRGLDVVERWIGWRGRRPAWNRCDALLGDLAEEHRSWLSREPRWRADLRYGREVLALLLRFLPRALIGAAESYLLAEPKRRSAEKHAMQSLWSVLRHDVRIAVRSLWKHPAPALLMILTLGAALGVNAAMFGVFDALIARPFDFPNLDRLTIVRETSPGEYFEASNVAPANLDDWRAGAVGSFESLVAIDTWDGNLRGREGPERVRAAAASVDFFEQLGQEAALGRLFLPEDRRGNSSITALVLSDTLWRRRFAGDPAIVGREVDLDGQPFTVIGVARPGFAFPSGAETWVPERLSPADRARRDQRYLLVLGRLAPGVTREAAQQRLSAVAGELAERFPETNVHRGVAVETLSAGMRDAGLGPILFLWQVAAAVVLMIAWVNLANLALTRGGERRRDLAVLDALGAGRARLVRMLAIEGAVVAAAAAAFAVPVAWLALHFLRAGMPQNLVRFIPGWERIAVDGRSLAFTGVLAAVSVVGVNLWPALRATGKRMAGGLRDGGRGASSSRGVFSMRGRGGLVVAEVALGLALLIVAGLASKAARTMMSGPQGYDPDSMLVFTLNLPDAVYGSEESRRAFARQTEARLAEVHGAVAVAYANVLPAVGHNTSRGIAVEGEAEPDASNPQLADLRTVSSSYFETLSLPLLSGRGFTALDGPEAAPVAVISRSMAERFWPGREAIGRKFRAGDAAAPWLTVVGVSGDHVHHWFARRSHPTFYTPFEQRPTSRISFAVRAQGDPSSAVAAVRAAVASVDPDQPIYDIRTQRDSLAEATVGLRYVAMILGVFASLAWLLAVTGVYGVVSYGVSTRVREFGVRVALGATARDVLRMTLGQAMSVTVAGLVVGAALGVWSAGLVSGVLRGAGELSAQLVAVSVAALALAALVAAYVPVRRAMGLDPVLALRGD